MKFRQVVNRRSRVLVLVLGCVHFSILYSANHQDVPPDCCSQLLDYVLQNMLLRNTNVQVLSRLNPPKTPASASWLCLASWEEEGVQPCKDITARLTIKRLCSPFSRNSIDDMEKKFLPAGGSKHGANQNVARVIVFCCFHTKNQDRYLALLTVSSRTSLLEYVNSRPNYRRDLPPAIVLIFAKQLLGALRYLNSLHLVADGFTVNDIVIEETTSGPRLLLDCWEKLLPVYGYTLVTDSPHSATPLELRKSFLRSSRSGDLDIQQDLLKKTRTYCWFDRGPNFSPTSLGKRNLIAFQANNRPKKKKPATNLKEIYFCAEVEQDSFRAGSVLKQLVEYCGEPWGASRSCYTPKLFMKALNLCLCEPHPGRRMTPEKAELVVTIYEIWLRSFSNIQGEARGNNRQAFIYFYNECIKQMDLSNPLQHEDCIYSDIVSRGLPEHDSSWDFQDVSREFGSYLGDRLEKYYLDFRNL